MFYVILAYSFSFTLLTIFLFKIILDYFVLNRKLQAINDLKNYQNFNQNKETLN